MPDPNQIVEGNGINNISDVVQNMNVPGDQISVTPEFPIPDRVPQGSIDNRFTAGDFTQQYLQSQDAAREMDKLFNAQFPDNPAIGALPENMYFPGMNDPILKGYSSSKTLGNQPIFVRSGGFYPVGVLEAREKAIQDAAAKRAMQLRAFDIPKAPLTKDPRFQENLNESFNNTVTDFIDQAKTVYGDKALWVLQNDKTNPLTRKFHQALDNYDVLARETDQVTDLVSAIRQGNADKTMTYSPETLKKLSDFEKLTGQFEGGKVDVNLRKNLNELKGSQALDIYLNKNVYPELEAEVNEAWGQFKSEGDLNVARQSMRTTYKDLAKKTAKRLKESEYANEDWITEESIYNRIIATKGDKFESDLKAMNKPSEKLSGYDAQSKSEINVQDHKSFVYTDPKTGENKSSVAFTNWVDTKPAKNAKPLNITGGTYYSVGDESGDFGKTINRNRNEVLALTPTGFGDAVIQGKKQQVVVGTITDKRKVGEDANGNPKYEEFTETIMMPMHQNEAEFRNNMPNTYDVYQENSDVRTGDAGIKSTTTVTTDKQGNQTSSNNKTKQEGKIQIKGF